uniref:Uncharacterized protein n=1 Tax=Urocitellus parryii TaxID=9999 RepID=A0A8D2IFK3_UROPR
MTERSITGEPKKVSVQHTDPCARVCAGNSGPGQRYKVAPVLKERMVKEGSMMIGYQPRGTQGNFFRMVVASPTLTCADIDFLLHELEQLGQDL